jgi:hypothetical protein
LVTPENPGQPKDGDCSGRFEVKLTSLATPPYTVGVPKADQPKQKTLRELYPNLSPEQLAQADEDLKEYVALAWRVFERIEEDPEAYEELLRALEERQSEWERLN